MIRGHLNISAYADRFLDASIDESLVSYPFHSVPDPVVCLNFLDGNEPPFSENQGPMGKAILH